MYPPEPIVSELNYKLINTCTSGDYNCVLNTIKEGATSLDMGLYYACYHGRHAIVLLLIENGASDWNGGLINACTCGHMNIVLLMIEKGATDLNRGLFYACNNHNYRAALLLIEKGADIDKCTLKILDGDIMRLVQMGHSFESYYYSVALKCRQILVERRHVLDPILIGDLITIVLAY